MMNSALLITATFLLGVDYKVERDNGENTYVVEIEESIAEQLTEGFEITSIVPAEHTHVDKIRISVVKDNRNNERGSDAPQGPVLPPLFPDSSILPQQSESSGSAELQLEPKELSMPDLTPRGSVIEARISKSEFAPEFDKANEKEIDSDDSTLALLATQEPIVSLVGETNAPPAGSTERLGDNNLPNRAPPATSPVGPSADAHRDTIDEPKQIMLAEDTFIALATHQDDDESKSSISDPKQVMTETNTTSLVLLLFSVTLNLFLGVHVFRHYRT